MEKKLQFGTDGIRGKSDQFPFTTQALQKLGLSIGKWATSKNNPRAIIGHDTRISCDRIKKDLTTGLQKIGIKILDAGVIPTPAILQIMKYEKRFDFGIVISASHNPYQDNGIKLFDSKFGKLSAEDENAIIYFFEGVKPPVGSQTPVGLQTPVKSQAATQKEPNFAQIYKKNIIKNFEKNFLANKKIVLDCANGSTYKVGPEIFSSLGAEVISINVDPNGKNINEKCGALHPGIVQKEALKNKADIGFAFDGDGDRVITINKNGEIKDGDDMLSILTTHPDLNNETTIVGTIMTNYGLETNLFENKKKLIRTKVGDKHIAAYLNKNNLLLGGESSGHIIIKKYLNTGDGIFVALKVLESIIKNDNWEMKTFKKTPQFMVNLPVIKKENLYKNQYKNIIKSYEKQLIDGRIIVRYSGTENLLRVMAEDQTKDSAKKIATNLSNELKSALDNQGEKYGKKEFCT